MQLTTLTSANPFFVWKVDHLPFNRLLCCWRLVACYSYYSVSKRTNFETVYLELVVVNREHRK